MSVHAITEDTHHSHACTHICTDTYMCVYDHVRHIGSFLITVKNVYVFSDNSEKLVCLRVRICACVRLHVYACMHVCDAHICL